MGGNVRYGAQIEQRSIMRGKPLSLTRDELELDVRPLTTTPVAIAAMAWIRYPTGAVRIRVEVIEWTELAVHCRWVTPNRGAS